MKVLAEIFKGIEFIRISNLPEDQKNFIVTSVPKDKIIMILKDNVVMKDCIQYHDYVAFYSQFKSQPAQVKESHHAAKKSQPAYKFAFK